MKGLVSGNKWIVSVHRFSFARDFRSIKWGPTLGYNLWRAGCAGLVLGALMFIFPKSDGERAMAIAAPLVWPVFYLIFLLPLGLLLGGFADAYPAVRFFQAVLALIGVTLGDPIVCLVEKFLPRLIPVRQPPLASTEIIILVLDAPQITIAP